MNMVYRCTNCLQKLKHAVVQRTGWRAFSSAREAGKMGLEVIFLTPIALNRNRSINRLCVNKNCCSIFDCFYPRLQYYTFRRNKIQYKVHNNYYNIITTIIIRSMFPLLIITCIVAILAITDALQVIKQQPTSFLLSKRDVLKRGIIATAAIIDGGASFSLSSKALDPVGRIRDSKGGLLSPYDVAEMLRPVPTFTIVDKAGVPFTVVGEDAKVTGYFFTTFPEADRILRLAKTSAKKAIAKTKVDDPQTNPWNQARISTVPLDYAVTLVSKSNRIFFKIAPAEDDVKNALAVTGDDDLSEGKVPLFYYDDDSTIDTKLYFRKNQLEQEWRQLHPKNDSLPKTNVTELFSLLSELVRPGGTDNELKNLIFVPPKESMQKSIECLKKGGTEPPFVVGKSIIVL